MMFIRATLFQKVCLLLVSFCFLILKRKLFDHQKRIYNGSRCLVRRLFIQLDIYLRHFRAILHDPETYPDPEEFKPERFLNQDGSIRDDPALALAFGAGRRICPGRHIVDATLFIVASSVLSAFNVTKAKDENGNEIPVKAEVTVLSGIVV